MELFSVVLTCVVLVAVAVFILVFERKRARQIERDLRELPPGQRNGQTRRRRRS